MDHQDQFHFRKQQGEILQAGLGLGLGLTSNPQEELELELV